MNPLFKEGSEARKAYERKLAIAKRVAEVFAEEQAGAGELESIFRIAVNQLTVTLPSEPEN